MKITPLAADSMGGRSMATLVETEGVDILIDPGVGLASQRYGLPPHPLEEWCTKKLRERVEMYAATTDVIVITSFHPDHAILDDLGLYEDKILLVKNPNQDIGLDVRKQAFDFIRRVRDVAQEIQYADRRSFEIEGTVLTFSPPQPYGLEQIEGYVLSAALREGDTVFLFSSHVQGWAMGVPEEFVLSHDPGILYLDGPVTYLYGDGAEGDRLDSVLAGIRSVLARTKIHTLILDHHLLRDLHWETKIEPLRRFIEEKGMVLKTAAELRGESVQLLEARRQALHSQDRVS